MIYRKSFSLRLIWFYNCKLSEFRSITAATDFWTCRSSKRTKWFPSSNRRTEKTKRSTQTTLIKWFKSTPTRSFRAFEFNKRWWRCWQSYFWNIWRLLGKNQSSRFLKFRLRTRCCQFRATCVNHTTSCRQLYMQGFMYRSVRVGLQFFHKSLTMRWFVRDPRALRSWGFKISDRSVLESKSRTERCVNPCKLHVWIPKLY